MAKRSLRPKTEVAKQLKTDVCRRNLLSISDVPGSSSAEHPEIVEANSFAATDCHTLTLKRRLCDLPSVVYLPDNLINGDSNIGEKHFVEVGDAVDLAERTDLDARRTQIDKQVRDPVSLGSVPIRAHSRMPQ